MLCHKNPNTPEHDSNANVMFEWVGHTRMLVYNRRECSCLLQVCSGFLGVMFVSVSSVVVFLYYSCQRYRHNEDGWGRVARSQDEATRTTFLLFCQVSKDKKL
jgi:hypothetical protein